MNDPLDGRPTRIGGALALLAGLVAAMVGAGYSTVGALCGLAGIATLLVGMVLPRPRLMSVGASSLGVAVFIAALRGGTAPVIAVGTIGAVMAWDLGHNAASHGRQVGQFALTGRAEGVHALGSLIAGALSGMIGVGIFMAAAGGQPATAVALLGVASIIIVLALR